MLKLDSVTVRAAHRLSLIFFLATISACGAGKLGKPIEDNDQDQDQAKMVDLVAETTLEIQAENFSRNGEGVNTTEGDCRVSDLGIKKRLIVAAGDCIAVVDDADEWLEYDFNVAESGIYSLTLAVNASASDRIVEILVNDQPVGAMSMPLMSSNIFEELELPKMNFQAGAATLKMVVNGDGVSFDYFKIAAVEIDDVTESSSSSSSASSSSSSTSSSGTVEPIKDADGDGIADEIDECPDTKGLRLFSFENGTHTFFLQRNRLVDPRPGVLFSHDVYTTTDINSTGPEGFSKGQAEFHTSRVDYYKEGELAEITVALPSHSFHLYCEMGVPCKYEVPDYPQLLEVGGEFAENASSPLIAINENYYPPFRFVMRDGCSVDQWDRDNDGVSDRLDICANSPAGEDINIDGCALSQLDTDKDTIADSIDQCPDSTEGEVVNKFGCPDEDNDLVVDDIDQCSQTPIGEVVDEIGCSDTQKDTDSDTVNDATDVCPLTPPGEAIDVNGCSDTQKDTDSDTVNDATDVCPLTPPGEAIDVNGCSDTQKDTDSDGVNDALDECESTPADELLNLNGCSVSQIDEVALFSEQCSACHVDASGGGGLISIDGKTIDDFRVALANVAVMAQLNSVLSEADIVVLGEYISEMLSQVQ